MALRFAAALGPWFALAPAVAWDHPEEGQFIARRYVASDYGASGGAWAFTQAPNGDQFIGTDRIFLSRGWWRVTTVETPLTREFKALDADPDGIVWAGAVGELGYLRQNEMGDYDYQSLRKQFMHTNGGQPPESMLAVVGLGSGRAIFCSTTGLHHWNGQNFSHRRLSGTTPPQPLRPKPGLLWLYHDELGVVNPAGDLTRPVLPVHELPGPVTWMIAPLAESQSPSPHDAVDDGWLLGTRDAVYVRQSARWLLLPRLTAEIAEARATVALPLTDEAFAIATQRRGVIIASRDDSVLGRLSQEQSLGDNQVLALRAAVGDEVWVGTSVGWSRLSSPRMVSLIPADEAGRSSAAVRSVVRHEGRLHVATARGAWVLEPGTNIEGRARLSLLPAPPAPLWHLDSLDGMLLAGGVGGIWRWDGSIWSQALATRGDVLHLTLSRNGAHVHFTEGTHLRRATRLGNGQLQIDSWLLELEDTPVSLVEDPHGNLWLSTALGRVVFVRPHTAVDAVKIFRAGEELPALLQRPRLGLLADSVLLYTEDGVFRYEPAQAKFIEAPEFRGMRVLAFSQSEDADRLFWALERRNTSGSQVYFATVQPKADKWEVAPLAVSNLASAGRPEVMLVDPDHSALWIGGARNLMRIGPDGLRAALPPGPTRLVSVSAVVGRRAQQAGAPKDTNLLSLPIQSDRVKLPSDTQSVRFTLSSSPNRDGSEVFFETQLVGLESEWSPPIGGYREFTGLAAGKYEFRVRAIDRTGRTGPMLSYRFRRQAAWYARWPAWLAYAAALGGIVTLGMRWRLRQLRRQNETLNRIVNERTRELAMANSAKMEFLASISHEIRNPLNGITGLVTLLSQASLAPRERELAQSLSACAASLRRVFEEVLDFARLEQGRVAIIPSRFELRPLLEDVACVFAAEADQRGCRILVETPADAPELFGDESKIRTIVSNFVANALKYAPGTPIEISAATEWEGAMFAVALQVHDRGPGIPAEEQELIFRKFARGSSAEIQREPGAGLGLATCQALARLLGGSIGVESTPGDGATFYLQLRLPAAAGNENQNAMLPSPPAPPGVIGGTALLIEDQPYNQLVTRSILERVGYNVRVASTGTEARQQIARGGFSLALVDWDVPGAKGDELARLIRDEPDGAQIIIVAVTAHDAPEVREQCLQAGMDGFVLKPLDESLLLLTLRSVREHLPTSLGTARGGARLPDFTVFDYLGRNEPHATDEAIRDYLRELDSEMRGLDAAFAAGQAEEIARRAHRLRAHASIVRAGRLQSAAQLLQDRAREQPLDAIQSARRELQAEVDALTAQLHEWRRRRSAAPS